MVRCDRFRVRDARHMHLLKSKTKIAAGLALAFFAATEFQTSLHAQGGAGQTSPDAVSKTSPAQTAIPVALPKGKKLVLNDGTFQIAREYTVDGDRVRYWSVERSQWEEIPASLVNWDATHKAEADQAAEDAKLKSKIHASELAMH